MFATLASFCKCIGSGLRIRSMVCSGRGFGIRLLGLPPGLCISYRSAHHQCGIVGLPNVSKESICFVCALMLCSLSLSHGPAVFFECDELIAHVTD